jgi:hypothetical protein
MTELRSHPDNVKVGQVWQDNDPRMWERKLRVVGVGFGFVFMEDSGGKKRRYLLRRMRDNSRGFRLVEEVS